MGDLPEKSWARVIDYELGIVELRRVPAWLADTDNVFRLFRIPKRFRNLKPEDFDGTGPPRPPRGS